MKKILSTSLVLFSFIFIIILPVILWLYASLMSHHEMSSENCIEHCISSENQIYSKEIIHKYINIKFLLIKIVFSKIFVYSISLILLYVILNHAPPNLHNKIKNYNYSSLIGIVKLST